MKAYGLRNKLTYNYEDNHPSKGWVNWWEAEINTVKSKKAARWQAKKDIEKELDYYDYYHMPYYEQPWDFKDYEEIERD